MLEYIAIVAILVTIAVGLGVGLGLPSPNAAQTRIQDPAVAYYTPTFRPTTPSASLYLESTLLVFRANGPSVKGNAGLAKFDSMCVETNTQNVYGCASEPKALVATQQRANLNNVPSYFGYNASQRVLARLYDGNIVNFNTNWTTFLTMHGEYGYSIENMASPDAYYAVGPIGFGPEFAYDAVSTCLDWTSDWGTYYFSSRISETWIGTTRFSCSAALPMCVCAGNYSATNPIATRSPTPAPTKTPTTSLAPTTVPTAPTTQAPTFAPTRHPTNRPTTNAPTSAPVVLFADRSALRNGAMGNRATTTARCASAAASQSISCARPLALLSYLKDDIASMPRNYSFSADAPIKTTTGTTIASSWTQLAVPSSTLFDLGVFPRANDYYWTGSDTGGVTTSSSMNCNDWTQSGNFVIVGDTFDSSGLGSYPSSPWVFYESQGIYSCSATKYVVCLCLP